MSLNMNKLAPVNNLVYFSSLEISNVKCFGEEPQTLILKNNDGTISPWTLILGDNGIGKTTLLKCLAWMSPVESPSPQIEERLNIARALLDQKIDISNIESATGLTKAQIYGTEIQKIQIKPIMDDLEDESEYEKIMRTGSNIITQIKATFSKKTELSKKTTENNEFSVGIRFEKKDDVLEVVKAEVIDVDEYIAPKIYAYSASRHMVSKNTDDISLKDPLYNLFSDTGDLYDAEQLLSDLYSTAALEEKDESGNEGNVTRLLNKVKELLLDLLPNINSVDAIIINTPLNDDGSKRTNLVEIITSQGKVPLYNLSLGYKTMLSWAVDLAIRMLWDNPDSDNPLKEPAIVIIDEIDLHLHPHWQRSLRDYLTLHFTQTQFICTAHSPFMAQASVNENLCVVNRIDDLVIINNDPEIVAGWKIGQIITSDLFGIRSERSPEFEDMIQKRRGLLKKNTLTREEETQLKTLDQNLENLPLFDDENQKLFDQIKEMASILEKKSRND
jgi:predicted ATP-binding protein involved in virulence